MEVEDARTIGRRLRQVRNAREKSLRVVAGLAGISKSHLQRIERGERTSRVDHQVTPVNAAYDMVSCVNACARASY